MADSTFPQPAPGQSFAAYLDQVEETWNKRIDKDVEALGEGLGQLVKELENAAQPQPHITSTSTLSTLVQTQHLIASAESLSALTHQLKLWVLLSDEDAKIQGKDREMAQLQKELREVRAEVDALLA